MFHPDQSVVYLQENVLQQPFLLSTHSQSISPQQPSQSSGHSQHPSSPGQHPASGYSQNHQGLLHQSPGCPQSPERPYHQQPSFSSTVQSALAHRHFLGHLLPQPSLPKTGSRHPQESRQDSSDAAHKALLSEEAERMLRHMSPDGANCHARSLLRTPQHLVPLMTACQTATGLQTLDLSHNSLTDNALTHIEGKLQFKVGLWCLSISACMFVQKHLQTS